LAGSDIVLSRKNYSHYAGSMSEFINTQISNYTNDIILSVGSLLGKSSLLNLPRAPIDIGLGAVSFAVGTVGTAIGEVTNIFGKLTLENHFIEKQQRNRNKKKIQGVKQGAEQALNSVGDAVTGLFDIIVKPVEGAQEDGVKGFFTGLGQGAVNTVFKPVSKIGEAVSDIGAGISTQLAGNSDSVGVPVRRKKPPRVLFGEAHCIAVQPAIAGQAMDQIGPRILHNVDIVWNLGRVGSAMDNKRNKVRRIVVLLLYRRGIRVCELLDDAIHEDDDPEIFDTSASIEDSFSKIFQQVSKPINRLENVGDTVSSSIGNNLLGWTAHEDPFKEASDQSIRWTMEFKDLKSVHFVRQGTLIPESIRAMTFDLSRRVQKQAKKKWLPNRPSIPKNLKSKWLPGKKQNESADAGAETIGGGSGSRQGPAEPKQMLGLGAGGANIHSPSKDSSPMVEDTVILEDRGGRKFKFPMPAKAFPRGSRGLILSAMDTLCHENAGEEDGMGRETIEWAALRSVLQPTDATANQNFQDVHAMLQKHRREESHGKIPQDLGIDQNYLYAVEVEHTGLDGTFFHN
jgi:hypothetical protein